MNFKQEFIDNDIHDLDIGIDHVHIDTIFELAETQIGFSVDSEGNDLDDWIGKEYLVIGLTSLCNDPIMVNQKEKNFPVYFMFHDDYSSLMKISSSYTNYIKILKKIKETDLTEGDVEDLLSEIKKIESKYIDYWRSLLG